MSATNKRGQGIDGSTIALLVAVVAAFVVLGSVWGVVALGSQLEGRGVRHHAAERPAADADAGRPG